MYKRGLRSYYETNALARVFAAFAELSEWLAGTSEAALEVSSTKIIDQVFKRLPDNADESFTFV